MVRVQVREKQRVEPPQIDSHFAKSHERARTHVDQDPGDRVDENAIARGGTAGATRSARAEHRELETRIRLLPIPTAVDRRAGGTGPPVRDGHRVRAARDSHDEADCHRLDRAAARTSSAGTRHRCRM